MAELIIMFREVLEASLIIGILYTYLNKSGNKDSIKMVWSGVLVAVLASIIIALIFGQLAIGLKDSEFKFYSTCSHIPKLYTVAYALSIVASGKAKKIYLAGFDGYQRNDRRLKIVDEIFQSFQKTRATPSITAITPSGYNIQKKSIYTL